MFKKELLFDIAAGFLLWVVGFALGMLLFTLIPASILGWYLLVIIVPLTIIISLYRFKERNESIKYFLFVASVWLLIPIILDFIIIVLTFNVQNFYDIDLLIYYALTFIIPLSLGLEFGRGKN